MTAEVNIRRIAPSTFVQVWQGNIAGVWEYVGLQEVDSTHALVVFSAFVDAPASNGRASAGSYVVTGIDGVPFVSVRRAVSAWIHRPTTWQGSESGGRHSEGSTGFGLTSSAGVGTCETKSL